MDSLWSRWIPTFATITIVAIIILFDQYRPRLRFRAAQTSRPQHSHNLIRARSSAQEPNEKLPASFGASSHNDGSDRTDIEELNAIKQVYYQLHALENFPEVLPKAKTFLCALLKETSAAVEALPEHESISSITTFSPGALEDFQRRRDKSIGENWERYNLRRNAGGPRELFADREEAVWWLKQIAPIKYVDGAWLGHVGKVTAPFALQKILKGLWQVFSEELGDGDLGKNHAHLYRKLLESIAPGFPTAEMLDFGHPRYQLDNLPVWKSAIAQLLISLFPSEFLPEILGFNLHFEAVSMDTLKAGKELREVGIDPYYFILHVSIDNAHSGHTAIAMQVVCEYMNHILTCEGEDAVQRAWKRLQAGYHLSMGLPGTVVCPSRRKPMKESDVDLSLIEMDVMDIFRAKAEVVHGIHCSSRLKIGSRSVAEWLDPVALESKRWQKALLDALSNSRYWVRKGESGKSRFIKELQWSGRMFGSFTQDEYNVLRKWIDHLSSVSLVSGDMRSGLVTDSERYDELLAGNPVFLPSSTTVGVPVAFSPPLSATILFSFQNLPPLGTIDRPEIRKFFPIWLAHPSLLQSFVSVPFRTTNRLACAVIRILRAQKGFDLEQECVAGMGEVRRPDRLGLAGIGIGMMKRHDLLLSQFPSLKHVLQAWPSEFAVDMLDVSARPLQYKGLLIGMATAFAKMHNAMARSPSRLLTVQDQVTLQGIAERELEDIGVCWEELKIDGTAYDECCRGYLKAKHKIEECFQL